jgi:hypothetical protein
VVIPAIRAGRRRLLVSIAVVLALTAAGVLTAEWLRAPQTPAARAGGRPSALPPGPGDPGNKVVGTDGAQIFCPNGAAPSITVNNADFEPTLGDGRSFAAGAYRIKLRGLVINETNATIAVSTYVVTVGDVAWPAAVHGPSVVAAGSADEITVDGTYDSAGPAQASVHVSMQWVWSATSLRPCGQRGLVEDD